MRTISKAKGYLNGVMAILMVAFLSVSLASCGDDEKKDEPKDTDAAAMAAGTYKGSVAMSVMGTVVDPVAGEVELTATDETHVNVVIPELKYANFTIASVTVPAVEVTKAADGSVIIGAGSYSDSSITCKIISGKVSSTGSLTLDFTLQPGKMPMPINAGFTGSK
ncbi:MAG: calycin-like domain-containing protein [Muribaculaceae bacterium]|nr:calycin-like domain-containing protein [Muribaculaceae bacterium]